MNDKGLNKFLISCKHNKERRMRSMDHIAGTFFYAIFMAIM